MWGQASDGPLVAARHAGGSGPAIVFVHGVGSTAAAWDDQLRAFGDTFQCFAVELRGNGAAKDPDPDLITRVGFANDVLAIADAAGIAQFHFVGCSLGGVVAFELWRQAPERVISLTLAGTFAAYPGAQAHARAIADDVRAAGSMDAFTRRRVARLNLPPDRLAETLEQMGRKSVPSYLAATKATWTGDYRSMLGSITASTLVVCGELDTVAPLVLSQEIALGIAGARLEVIEGAGHVCNVDRPQEFNALLRSFLIESAPV